MSVVTVEGNLLSSDLLERLPELPGQKPADFGLSRRSLVDEISGQWQAARAYWAAFQARRERSAGESLTTVTRDFWMTPLLELLGYSLQRITPSPVVEGRTYAISHWAGDSQEAPPVHIAGADLELGNRPPSGRGAFSPHALVQDYLNRTEHLWGIVTNGLQLRLLRDSSYFTRPAFVEFDLASMFQDEQFDAFVQLYRLAHRTRLPQSMDGGPECLLERWHQQGIEEGGRIRDGLRGAVTEALRLLGNGFLRHPGNGENLPREPREFYRQLLYLVYRLLFLLVAEERDLLRTAEATPEQREHYDRWLGLGHLRDLARTSLTAPERFDDLWLGLQTLFHFLRHDEWAAELGLSPLNGGLFRQRDLDECQLDNRSLLQAVRSLTLFTPPGAKGERPVNYRHLDVEELGSVYESLLDYEPVIHPGTPPTFGFAAGGERKSAGAYYTPSPLVQELIKSALVPVLAERLDAAGDDREAQAKAILSLTICDPACGSGHFLLGAARRLGKELAVVRTGEMEPSPDAQRDAVREVIGHCLYGVDKNPLAVDLCKVALWIEGHSRGRPLTFLEHRVREGDSLVGVFDLKVLEDGIPDGAYTSLAGDDKAVVTALRKQNRFERDAQQGSLFSFVGDETLGDFSAGLALIDELPDATPEDIRGKEYCYEQARASRPFLHTKMLCDAWTAAFFLPKTAEYREHVPTTVALHQSEDWWNRPGNRMRAEVDAAASRLRLFHWPLEFKDVFDCGGFDVVLGNPPWDQLQPEEAHYFAACGAAEIATAAGATRKKLIERLAETDPALARGWALYQREVQAAGGFASESGRFRLTAAGKLNTYALFADLDRLMLGPAGRAGLIAPTGLVTDDSTKAFFGDLVRHGHLVRLIGFENEAFIFAAVHHAFKFCALTVSAQRHDTTDLTFFCRYMPEVGDARRRFAMTPADFALVNPNTRTCPTFRTNADATLTKSIYRRVPVLIDEEAAHDPWEVTFRQGLFNMTSDSSQFGNRAVEGALPLYEAKMIWQFDHRYGSYHGVDTRSPAAIPTPSAQQHSDATFLAQSWYWVPAPMVHARLGAWGRQWLMGFRDITAAMVERTAICALMPAHGVGHTITLMLPSSDGRVSLVACLLSCINSLALDYVARTKLTYVHLSQFVVKQLPVLPPTVYATAELAFIVPRVLELVYTAWDIKPFADDLWRGADDDLRALLQAQADANRQATGGHPFDPPEWAEIAPDGCPLPPFRWDEARRAVLRAELDALYAKLYGLTRKQLRYILDPHGLSERELADILDPWEDPTCAGPHLLPAEPALDFPGETFRVLKEKEEKRLGEYRTRRLVLEAWERVGR